MNLAPRYKAIVAAIGGFLSPLISFYQINQNLTLRQVLASLVSAVVIGGVVHQVTNKPVPPITPGV